MVAAAVIGAGVLAAGSTVYASSQASNATQNATNAAITQQQNALTQQANLSAPYRQVGQDAIGQYEALLGLGPQGSPGIQQTLANTPGYQFALSQGQTGIENQASLSGGVGGNTLTALNKFNTGLADSTYQQQVGNIGQAVGVGQAAAAGQAQNVGNAANTIGSALINQGNTIAGIDANTAAGISQAISGSTDQYLTEQNLKALNNQGGGMG